MPEFDPKAPVTADNFERVMAALMEQAEARHAQMRAELQSAVSDGVKAGVMALVSDDEFMRKFWKRGYDEVTAHGRDDVSKSIGRRVMTWAAGVLLTVGIYVAVKAGAIK